MEDEEDKPRPPWKDGDNLNDKEKEELRAWVDKQLGVKWYDGADVGPWDHAAAWADVRFCGIVSGARRHIMQMPPGATCRPEKARRI